MNPSQEASATPAAPHPAGTVSFPFQQRLGVLASSGDDLEASITIETLPTIVQRTQLFTHAELSNCEVVVYPDFGCVDCPTSIRMCWSPATVAITFDDILLCPGSTSMLLSSFTAGKIATYPADFSFYNNIIKDPITYANTPRLTFSTRHVKTPVARSEPLCTLVLRGTLVCSKPTIGVFRA